MEKFLPVHYIELFHLHFLEQLGLKLDKKLYALKGGCNLRFFLKSIRYSQDMDIDVRIIHKETLAKTVRKILNSVNTIRFLKIKNIELIKISEPKQTETTQKWKFLLQTPDSSIPLNTKIEFSRRGIKGDVKLESIDPLILAKYQLNPIFAVHYSAESAFHGKIQALIGRTQTQARDVFDLFHLINLGVKKPKLSIKEREKIEQHALSISFEEFKSQVLAYLPPEYHPQYNSNSFWDQIVLRVIEEVSGEAN